MKQSAEGVTVSHDNKSCTIFAWLIGPHEGFYTTQLSHSLVLSNEALMCITCITFKSYSFRHLESNLYFCNNTPVLPLRNVSTMKVNPVVRGWSTYSYFWRPCFSANSSLLARELSKEIDEHEYRNYITKTKQQFSHTFSMVLVISLCLSGIIKASTQHKANKTQG